jgi:hypothetical protein
MFFFDLSFYRPCCSASVLPAYLPPPLGRFDRKFHISGPPGDRPLTTADTQADIPLPMPPIAFTDSQLDAIVRASQPLAPVDRGKFLQAVAEALRGRVIRDGAVYLAIAEAQRKYFAPPVLERVAGTSEWR